MRSNTSGNNGGFSRGGSSNGPAGNFANRNNNRKNDNRNRKRRNILGAAEHVDYLDIKLLQRFINDQGKILPRRITGVTAHQQRLVASAIKHARHLALLPFVAQDIS